MKQESPGFRHGECQGAADTVEMVKKNTIFTSSGYFDLRLLDGIKTSAGVSYKKLKLLECRKTILTQRRMQGRIV